MFEALSERGFVEFLAEIWERRGWTTAITEDDQGRNLISGDRESGERGLISVAPAEDATVAGKDVQTLVGLCDEKNVDVGVVATRGEFTDDAERIAEVNDIHLVGPATLETTVIEEGFEDLLEQYASEAPSLLERLPLLSSLPTIFRRPSPPPIPTRALTVLLIVVGVAAVAVVGAQSVGVGIGAIGLFPGEVVDLGGDSNELTVTAVSLTENADEAIVVAWRARSQSTLVTPNGTRYDPPAGETFVVVEATVTNERAATSTLAADTFGFAANDTVTAPQKLNGTESPLPVQLAPEESETVWLVFTVDESEDAGTLLGLPGENTPPIRFEHDSSVESVLEAQ